MIKNVFKEILITILLLTIMILLLGIIFYDDLTVKKIIPEIAKYETPQNIKDELNSTSTLGFQNEILTYELTDSDLKLYKKVNIYNPGKTNPFVDDTLEVEENTITNNNSAYTNALK